MAERLTSRRTRRSDRRGRAPDDHAATLDMDEAKRRYEAGPRLLLARRVVVLVVTFVSTVTVARLLSPRDFGLANMAVVILAFAQVVRDLGVTNAVLRKTHVSQQELTLIFWFNALCTVLVSGLLLALAPAAAAFYDEPVVTSIVMVSTFGFLVGGLTLQHRALMNRQLRFGAIAMVEIVGVVVGFVVTLVLAFVRHDVWAIVLGNLAQVLTSALLSVLWSGWRPGRPARTEGLWDLVKFGANSMVYAVSIFISQNTAVLLIGNQYGSAALGQFNRGQALFKLPSTNLVQPIAQATMPLLTRLRELPEQYREAYLRLVRQLSVFLMPLSVTVACAAIPLTQALLGERWHTAGTVLAALAPALAATGLAYAVGDVFVTQNRSAELRNLGLVELVIRVGAVVVGLQLGLVETAAAYSVATVLVAVIRVVVAGRKGPVTALDQVRASVTGLTPSLGAGLACLPWYLTGLPELHAAAAAVLLVSGFVGALVGAVVLPVSRAAFVDVVTMFFGKVRRRRKRASAA